MTNRASTIERHQVVVVGARVAGAATAMLLARAGHDVVLLDRSPFPSDTVSTHGIARGGVVQLSRWGLLDEVHATGAPAVREVLFRLGDGQDVRRIKHRAGVDHLVAPRRHALDAVLQDAAVRAGATLRTGVTVTGVRRRADGRVVGVDGRGPGGEPVAVEADIVIGADGVRSRMAGWLGAEVLHSSPSGTGTFYTYVPDVPLETEGVAYEFHVARDAFAGIFPTNDGVACVWLGAPTRTLAMLHSPGPQRVDGLLAAITAASPSLERGSAPARCCRPYAAGPTCPTSYVARSATRSPAGPAGLRPAGLRPAGRWWATPATTATPSPATGSPTPSATPSCSPRPSTAVCGTRACEATAMTDYQRPARSRCARRSTSPAPSPGSRPRPASSSCRSSSAMPSNARRRCSPHCRQPPARRPRPPDPHHLTEGKHHVQHEHCPRPAQRRRHRGVFATIGAVRNQPELGRFQFRVSNRWLSGTHNRGIINGFHGAGQEHPRDNDFVIEADHPAVLVGEDRGADAGRAAAATRWPPA